VYITYIKYSWKATDPIFQSSVSNIFVTKKRMCN